MKKGTIRSASIGILFAFVTILFVHHVYQTNKVESNLKEQSKNEAAKQKPIPDERFMSFLPHG